MGDESMDFQKAIVQIIPKRSSRARQLIVLLREVYIECLVLRKTVVFLRQCFADKFCRADLNDPKN